VLIAGFFHLLGRRGRRPPGFYVGLLAIVYAPVRFLFDFLRIVDVRYGGLTPGQWGALAVMGLGVFILVRAYKKGEAEASPVADSPA
jgi:phosphatidylglycerol:prolipoprotein diacylglycerol transferase